MTKEDDNFEATCSSDDHFFYFQFFKREEVQWLRVHYEGLTELALIPDTTLDI